MKTLSLLLTIVCIAFTITACSGDDDGSFNGVVLGDYEFEYINDDLVFFNLNEDAFGGDNIESSISLQIIKQIPDPFCVFVVRLCRKANLPLEGTYPIISGQSPDVDDSDITEYLNSNDRACPSWKTFSFVTENDTSLFTLRNPDDNQTFTIINNGNNVYTLKFNGNYYQSYPMDYDGPVSVFVNYRGQLNVQ